MATVADIENVLLRLALTDDAGLERVIEKLLPILLSNVTKEDSPVRVKVLEALSHISKRLRASPTVKLPVGDILAMRDATNPVQLGFMNVFLGLGLDRLSPAESSVVVPQLLDKLPTFPVSHKSLCLRTFLKLLPTVEIPTTPGERLEKFPALSDPPTLEAVCAYFCDVMMFAGLSASGDVPPGLSQSSLDLLRGSAELPLPTSTELRQHKLEILRLANAGLLPEGDAVLLAMAGATDDHHDVVERSEDLYRRLSKNAGVIEEPSFVRRLMVLFMGTLTSAATPEPLRRKPASIALKLRLLDLFTKSVEAAKLIPQNVQIVFDAWFQTGRQLLDMRAKLTAVRFSTWIFSMAPLEALSKVSPLFLSGLTKLLNQCLNPTSDSSDSSSHSIVQVSYQLKEATYSAFGQLSHKAPSVFATSVHLPTLLFAQLEREDPELRLCISESLSMIASGFAGATPTVLGDLSTLLLRAVESPEPRSRLSAVDWMKRVFPFCDLPARFACVRLCGDVRTEIRSAALAGLDVKTFLPKSSRAEENPGLDLYPPFRDLLAFFVEGHPSRLMSLNTQSCIALLDFCDRTLNAQRDCGTCDLTAVTTFASVVEHVLKIDPSVGGSGEAHEAAATQLAKLCSVNPAVVSAMYAGKLSWIIQWTVSDNERIRWSFAKLLGTAVLGLPTTTATPDSVPDSAHKLLKWLIDTAGKDSGARGLPQQHGALVALGYVVAALAQRLDAGDCQSLLPSAVQLLSKSLNHGELFIREAAAASLTIIVRNTVLPVPESGEFGRASLVAQLGSAALSGLAGTSETVMVVRVTQAFASCLGALAYHDPSASVQMAAVEALLSLSVKQSEDVLLTAGQALVEAVTGKVPPDSSTAILGANSADATVTSLSERHISLCHAIVDHTLRRPLVSIHAQERTAAAVWLLCIIHACGRIPSVLDSRLPIIQSAFIRLLGEKSEFAQESAANGLSVVYDCSPVSMRDALVHGMIDTFTTGRKSTDATLPSSATEDASGSETASVGAGPAGLALTAAGDSAYKELCAFANEVGQPDLIYRFLALSSHHASWHAKSGSSLVFEALLRSNARKEIEPHLMKLVPRLYRYQYDPTPRVQDAMSRLWMVLVNDPKVVVTAQFEPILKELLRAMSAENWRERRAGCAGLTDLLSGRTFGEVSQYLAAMWAACLRAIDDIKDTVRADAMTTLKTLGKLTMRLCNPELSVSSEAKQAAGIVLPYLLHEGITSSIKDAQAMCVVYLSEVMNVAGKLPPNLLIDVLGTSLEAMSSQEAPALQYLQLHSNAGSSMHNINVSAEQLESIRLSATKDTQMGKIVEKCVNQLRDTSIAELEAMLPPEGPKGGATESKSDDVEPDSEAGATKAKDVSYLGAILARLSELIKSGVGLPTRGASIRCLVTLADIVTLALKPFSPQLVRMLLAGCDDKSPALRQEFAKAAGKLIKFSKTGTVRKFVDRLKELHESGDESARKTVGTALLTGFKLSHDQLQGYMKELVPLIFMARQDADESSRSVWEDVWTNVASSPEHVIRLYLAEVVTAVCSALSSSSWAIKQQAANALAALTTTILPSHAVSSSSGPQPFIPALEADGSPPFCAELEPHVDQLVGVIVPQLIGRVWEGKHMILRALADVAVYCQPHFTPMAIRELLGHFAKIVAKPLSDSAVSEGPDYISALQWRIDAVTGAVRICRLYAAQCDCFSIFSEAIDAAFANFGQGYTISRVSVVESAAGSVGDGADAPKRSTAMIGMRQNAEAAEEKRASEKEALMKRNELMCSLIALVGAIWPQTDPSVAAVTSIDVNLPSHIVSTVLGWMKTAPFDAKSIGYAAIERILWRTACVGKADGFLSYDVINAVVDLCCNEVVTESRFGVVRADALSVLVTVVSYGFANSTQKHAIATVVLPLCSVADNRVSQRARKVCEACEK